MGGVNVQVSPGWSRLQASQTPSQGARRVPVVADIRAAGMLGRAEASPTGSAVLPGDGPAAGAWLRARAQVLVELLHKSGQGWL